MVFGLYGSPKMLNFDWSKKKKKKKKKWSHPQTALKAMEPKEMLQKEANRLLVTNECNFMQTILECRSKPMANGFAHSDFHHCTNEVREDSPSHFTILLLGWQQSGLFLLRYFLWLTSFDTCKTGNASVYLRLCSRFLGCFGGGGGGPLRGLFATILIRVLSSCIWLVWAVVGWYLVWKGRRSHWACCEFEFFKKCYKDRLYASTSTVDLFLEAIVHQLLASFKDEE